MAQRKLFESHLMGLKFVVDRDAWSSGQIGSKLWLCEELEKLNPPSLNIAILGGWYGMLANMMFIRDRLDIESITSYDIDQSVKSVAEMINNQWALEGRFKARTEDCNHLVEYDTHNLIINTSAEHFASMGWFENIPDGKWVVIQSNDMVHDTHVATVPSLSAMIEKYQLSELLYSGEKRFDYEDWGFSRFMMIGRK